MLGRDGIAGLVCLAVSLGLLVLTRGLPPAIMVTIGPAFYPRVVLSAMAALSAILIAMDLLAWHRRRTAPALAPVAAAPEAPAFHPNYGLVLATFVIFGLYVMLLPGLGFRAGTVLFVAALQVTLEWPRTWRRWAVVALVAVGTAAICFLVFEDYLSVLLPRGQWTGL
jgi:hypothetical protein